MIGKACFRWVAGSVFVATTVCIADQMSVTVADKLPVSSAGLLYLGNRQPLAPSPAMKLPPGAITPTAPH